MSQLPYRVKVVLAVVVGVALGVALNETVGPLPGPWNWLLLGAFVVVSVLVPRARRRSSSDRV